MILLHICLADYFYRVKPMLSYALLLCAMYTLDSIDVDQ